MLVQRSNRDTRLLQKVRQGGGDRHSPGRITMDADRLSVNGDFATVAGDYESTFDNADRLLPCLGWISN